MSQEDLAAKLGTKGPAIGRYERDEMKPSIEVASNMADILDVSLDWLAGRSDVHLDQQILTRITDVQQLPESDRESLLLTIDNFIKATKLKAIQ